MAGDSVPTVTGVVQRLRDDGVLLIGPDRRVALSAIGASAVSAIVCRHRIVGRWLSDEMGLDWAEADIGAGKIAHFFSEELVRRSFARLERSSACPTATRFREASAGRANW
ncbi:MAG TPA: iron dependent repressor, metal binding and dimerization domain protein [Candidatus Dormibacteraeota bacterium]|nr:iron dependent repressor, metal binding and dimerization domain protein [Candidatus Dormibacteraeota bacterium]